MKKEFNKKIKLIRSGVPINLILLNIIIQAFCFGPKK